MNILVLDRRWMEEDRPAFLGELVRSADRVLPTTTTCTVDGALEVGSYFSHGDSVVAVGGGGVLDKAKLASLELDRESIYRLGHGRAGVVILDARKKVSLHAIPTTLGTGSEVNDKAVVDLGSDRRRLVISKALRPNSIAREPAVYRGLTKRQVQLGLIEVFLRAVGVYVACGDGAAEVYRCFAYHSARLLRAAESIPCPQGDSELMAEAAVTSGATHQVKFEQHGLVWVWPLWYLANELSLVAGLSKMDATLALIGPFMGRFGQFGHGTRTRLNNIERYVGSSLQSFVFECGGVVSQRARQKLSLVDVERVSRSCYFQWAGNGFALRGVSFGDLCTVFAEACGNRDLEL